ncbi:PTS sugar transporter subunit IIA [Novosphingopyxis iocasae]|uniref:PTS sugar transporter subunit IIA n=1 Tax=Novosphingopyxis iocasae TaxID=2762729 RepID=UPI001BE49898|nr:PTS sugar transporter subunit IIA [Novosphingopyxis iocasae]
MNIQLSCGLREDAVMSRASIASKHALFDLLSQQAEAAYGLDAEQLRAALEQRESLGSTGFGSGVAIPHARLAGLDEPLGLFVRLDKALDYASIDDRPVDLIFCLVSPAGDGARHLRVLAEVSRTMRSESNQQRLRGAADAAAIFSLLSGLYEFDAA